MEILTYDFTDTRQATSRGLNHELPVPLAERARELLLVVPSDDVVEPRLPAELVYPLRDLVARSLPQPGEQREQSPTDRRGGLVPEDDRRERAERDLWWCETE